MPEVNKLLSIPDDREVLAIVPFGYPAKVTVKGKKKRKPVSEVLYHEKFGQA
jgi:nitroreductase